LNVDERILNRKKGRCEKTRNQKTGVRGTLIFLALTSHHIGHGVQQRIPGAARIAGEGRSVCEQDKKDPEEDSSEPFTAKGIGEKRALNRREQKAMLVGEWGGVVFLTSVAKSTEREESLSKIYQEKGGLNLRRGCPKPNQRKESKRS